MGCAEEEEEAVEEEVVDERCERSSSEMIVRSRVWVRGGLLVEFLLGCKVRR